MHHALVTNLEKSQVLEKAILTNIKNPVNKPSITYIKRVPLKSYEEQLDHIT